LKNRPLVITVVSIGAQSWLIHQAKCGRLHENLSVVLQLLTILVHKMS